jgi:hypothetical protein
LKKYLNFMFEKKKILTCTIVFAIIIASFIYIEQLKEYSPFPNEVKVTTLKTQEIRSLHEKSIPPLEASFKNNVLIKVFRKNGEIETYFKKDDPWVLNLPKLIMDILLGGCYGGTSSAFTFEDGTTGTMIDTEGGGTNPTLLIGIGNGAAAFSVTDYRLSNKITLISVPSTAVAISDNGTCYNLNATASYTASSLTNITETGLFIVVDKATATSTTTNVNLMLARNKLASNITLNSGDTISIAYVLYFPYGKPFTKQFFGLMLNYFFGLMAYGKQISFTTTDGTSTPYDDMANDAGSTYDNVKENLYLVLGNASTIWNYTVYKLKTQIATSASPIPFTFSYNSTHAILKNPATYSFSSSAKVQEVGFLIKSIDINTDGTYSAKDVLVMYFNLTSPINIPAGGTFKFNCTIYIRLV